MNSIWLPIIGVSGVIIIGVVYVYMYFRFMIKALEVYEKEQEG